MKKKLDELEGLSERLRLNIQESLIPKISNNLLNSNKILERMVNDEAKKRPSPNYMVGIVVTYNVKTKVYEGLIIGASYEMDGPFTGNHSWVYEIKRGRRTDTVPESSIIEVIATNMQDMLKRL